MKEEASFRMFFGKFRASKRKLEIDDPKPPKMRNVLIHYEKREAPVEFASTVEEHYHQIFIQQKYYFENLQAMEKLVLKALHEEVFGPEL